MWMFDVTITSPEGEVVTVQVDTPLLNGAIGSDVCLAIVGAAHDAMLAVHRADERVGQPVAEEQHVHHH